VIVVGWVDLLSSSIT